MNTTAYFHLSNFYRSARQPGMMYLLASSGKNVQVTLAVSEELQGIYASDSLVSVADLPFAMAAPELLCSSRCYS